MKKKRTNNTDPLADFDYVRIIDNAETGYRVEWKKKGESDQCVQLDADSNANAIYESSRLLSVPESQLTSKIETE